MCRMCFQGTRRASKGIKQIANCSLHEDIFNQSGWMIMQYLAGYWIRHAGTGVFTHKTKRSLVWNEYLKSERTVNSQRIVDLKQAIQARYAPKYGPVTLHSEEFKAETENVTRGQRDFSGGGGGRVRDYESRQMYSATCASCGEETQVPFQPRGDRPVYCSVCYQAQRPGLSNGRRSRWS
jgi:CxxC-x17-CxxC domain-containing protein